MRESAGSDFNKEPQDRSAQTAIAIFVMSCDRTSDVARLFIAAFRKYWPDCPYPIYFGINQDQSHLALLGATPLPSEIKGWQKETIQQLQILRALSPETTHVLVFLDDFILSEKVNTPQIRRVLSDAAAKDIAYLRLRRLEEGIVGRLEQHLMKRDVFGNEACIKVRSDHPYYSSLQIALWRLDHLNTLLEQSDDIWTFECLKDTETTHYAVLRSLIKYRHVVEKGEWDIIAEAHCLKVIGWFDPNDRPRRMSGFRAGIVFHLSQLRFLLFGYLPMRLKKQIFRHKQKAHYR